MKTINIKGKEYVPVHERVIYFRGSDQYKNWSIITEIVNMDSEIATIKATILNEEGVVKATGHAFELQTDTHSFVNKTSYLENAETSAVGRALGLLGIGIENSFASADEIKNAQKQQNNPELQKPWLSKTQFNKAIDRIRGNDPGEFESLEEFVKNIEEQFRMKKAYREQLKDEINDPFNKALQNARNKM